MKKSARKSHLDMRIPVINANTDKVCKLKKALLYGLKQAPRAWFQKFSQTMKKLRHKQCNGDHTHSSSTSL